MSSAGSPRKTENLTRNPGLENAPDMLQSIIVAVAELHIFDGDSGIFLLQSPRVEAALFKESSYKCKPSQKYYAECCGYCERSLIYYLIVNITQHENLIQKS